MKIYIIVFVLLIMGTWTSPENDVFRTSLSEGRKPDLDVADFGFTEQEVKRLINGRQKSRVTCAEHCKILLNGSTHDIKDMKSGELMGYIWAIDKMNLSETTKVAIWDVIKGEKTCKEIKPKFLRQMKSLVLSIPDPDLYQLNMSSIEMVLFLGKVKGFNRRQLGVLAYSMKNTLGENVIRSATVLNQINGLLCGFPPQSLEKIAPKILLAVNKTVFKHVTSCTSRQLKVLLEHAKSHEAYGPTSSWSSDHVSNLGLLLTGLDIDDIRQLRPRGIKGLAPSIIEAMSLEQLEGMSLLQLEAMKDDTLSAYRRKTGVTNYQSPSAVPSRCLIAVLCMIYFFDNLYKNQFYDFTKHLEVGPYGVPIDETKQDFVNLVGLLATLLYASSLFYVYGLYKKYVKAINFFDSYHLRSGLEITGVENENAETRYHSIIFSCANFLAAFMTRDISDYLMECFDHCPEYGKQEVLVVLDDFWLCHAKPVLEKVVRAKISTPLWMERRCYQLTYPQQQLFQYEDFCHNVEIAIEKEMHRSFNLLLVTMVKDLYNGDVPCAICRAFPELEW